MSEDSTSNSASPQAKLQFSIRNLLKACSWLAVWLTLCGLFRQGAPPPWLPEFLAILIPLGIVSLPLVAIGSLFGKAEAGFLLGIILFVLMILPPQPAPM